MIDERQTEEIRRDFPLLSGDFAYLDNSATTQRPMCVIKAVEDFYTSCNANPMRGLYDLSIRATDSYENARSSAARFINAAPDEIVFTAVTDHLVRIDHIPFCIFRMEFLVDPILKI